MICYDVYVCVFRADIVDPREIFESFLYECPPFVQKSFTTGLLKKNFCRSCTYQKEKTVEKYFLKLYPGKRFVLRLI